MHPGQAPLNLTSALEDYLETIYEFTQRQGFIRVKDIARVRNVKAGSVSPAMRRLAELGLIEYERREYIRLTTQGETMAREIFSRHEVLSRFFSEILRMDRDEAVRNACAMEHSLTEDARDHLVLFMEFLLNCPEVDLELWRRFHDRQTARAGVDGCGDSCLGTCVLGNRDAAANAPVRRLADLLPGHSGVVSILEGDGDERRQLLNMGIIPGSTIALDHHHADGLYSEVIVDGYLLSFPRAMAGRVILGEVPTAAPSR